MNQTNPSLQTLFIVLFRYLPSETLKVYIDYYNFTIQDWVSRQEPGQSWCYPSVTVLILTLVKMSKYCTPAGNKKYDITCWCHVLRRAADIRDKLWQRDSIYDLLAYVTVNPSTVWNKKCSLDILTQWNVWVTKLVTCCLFYVRINLDKCDKMTAWQADCVTRWLFAKMTEWRDDCVTRWLFDKMFVW